MEKKDQIVARIAKHYIDNDLGIFNLGKINYGFMFNLSK